MLHKQQFSQLLIENFLLVFIWANLPLTTCGLTIVKSVVSRLIDLKIQPFV